MVYHTLLCFLLFLSELEAHIDAGKAMSLTPLVVGLKDAEPSLRLSVEVKPQARRRRTLKLVQLFLYSHDMIRTTTYTVSVTPLNFLSLCLFFRRC